MLAFTLTAFLELMDHGIVSWDMVSITFIKQVRPPAFCLSLLPQSPIVLQAKVGMQSMLHSGMARLSIPEARLSSWSSALPVVPARLNPAVLSGPARR